eukprot:Gb_30028 [translate_table: standard]
MVLRLELGLKNLLVVDFARTELSSLEGARLWIEEIKGLEQGSLKNTESMGRWYTSSCNGRGRWRQSTLCVDKDKEMFEMPRLIEREGIGGSEEDSPNRVILHGHRLIVTLRKHPMGYFQAILIQQDTSFASGSSDNQEIVANWHSKGWIEDGNIYRIFCGYSCIANSTPGSSAEYPY